MGRKVKVGKQRKDKFYQLAKESGYRARSAFKLIQLNRKFAFLERARILVDLCAAPGGWMQVAQENMPLSSLVVGVDLCPIQNLRRNSVSIQADITTEACRRELEAATQSQPVDVVLHDGAPNVGKSWVQDAFTQAQLVLHALRLATKLLRKGGTFVTKIFRSKDHPALVAVFHKLFAKVAVTKPQASRNESAEIFAVCSGYLKPSAVDPALLDPQSVFRDLQLDSQGPALNILHPEKKKKFVTGYEEGDLRVYHALPARDFIEADNFVEVLGRANQLRLDDQLREHPSTTKEVEACLADVQVLGRRELRLLLDWRKGIRKEEAEKLGGAAEATAEEIAEEEPTEEERVEEELAKSRYEEKQAAKRRKRKEASEKAKRRRQVDLEMIHPGDRPDIAECDELFSLNRVARAKSHAASSSQADEAAGVEEEVADENEKKVEEEEEMELAEEEAEEIGGEELLVTEESGLSQEDKSNRREELWFQRASKALPEIQDDEDEDDAEFAQLLRKLKKRNAQSDKAKEEEPSEETAESSQDKSKSKKAKSSQKLGEADAPEVDEDGAGTSPGLLSAEELAMGATMLHSSKSARDMEEAGWNRYTHNDDDLPDWFVADEKRHFRRPLPVDPTVVAEMRKRSEAVGTRTSKKVLEAKARKKKRELAKRERLRKKAAAVSENAELGSAEKAAEMRKLARAGMRKKEPVKLIVASKGSTSGRKVRRPPGVKGKFKVVDPRMKKDLRKAKAANAKGKGKKGKKPAKGGARPNKRR